MRVRTLPTIKSKESALRLEVKKTKDEVVKLEQKLEDGISSYQHMVGLWNEFNPELISVKDVKLSTKKIAGVIVPVLDKIDFEVKPFSLFNSPSWFSEGLDTSKMKRVSLNRPRRSCEPILKNANAKKRRHCYD